VTLKGILVRERPFLKIQDLARQVLYHLSHTPTLFALALFLIGSYVYAWAGLDHDPGSVYVSYVAGVIGMSYCAQMLVEMGSCSVLLLMTLNYSPPNLSLLSSWDYRCESQHLARSY
jgi:hypothetical protein